MDAPRRVREGLEQAREELERLRDGLPLLTNVADLQQGPGKKPRHLLLNQIEAVLEQLMPEDEVIALIQEGGSKDRVKRYRTRRARRLQSA